MNAAIIKRWTVVEPDRPASRRRRLLSSSALVLLERIPMPTLAVLRDGIIVFANGAFAEMVGRDAEEVVSLSFHDIFYGAPTTESALSVVDGLANMVVELAHRDGSTMRALMTKSALRRSDEEIALATSQDLTEHFWVNKH
jgi:PAS domain S-box-containing protein